jgi:hypothetical protein
LSELLPLGGAQHASTVRNRTLRVGAEVVRTHAAETANQPAAPASGPVVVGLDGGYVRSRHRAEGRRFEAIAGKVIHADGAQHRFAFTRTGPTATTEAFRAALAAVGVSAETPATVLCDGDGGLWRLQRRFLTRSDQVLFIRKFPVFLPGRRSVPSGVEPRAASQWKIYSRRHAERLLQIVEARPDLIAFWRTTLVPDETFAASILGSRSLLGDDVLPPSPSHAWHVAWRDDEQDHPGWLDMADFPVLAAAARAEPVEPLPSFPPSGDWSRPGRKLFARKFSSSRSAALLDRVDRELSVS